MNWLSFSISWVCFPFYFIGRSHTKAQMAIHSSILAQEILWAEEPSGLQSMGLGTTQRLNNNTKSLLGFRIFQETSPIFPLPTCLWANNEINGFPSRPMSRLKEVARCLYLQQLLVSQLWAEPSIRSWAERNTSKDLLRSSGITLAFRKHFLPRQFLIIPKEMKVSVS